MSDIMLARGDDGFVDNVQCTGSMSFRSNTAHAPKAARKFHGGGRKDG